MVAAWSGRCGAGTRRLLGVVLSRRHCRTRGSGRPPPAFFFLRLGLLVASIAVAYAWERRPTAGRRWSPLQLLGRSSLFIYWIHVEMVYGIVSTPLHGGLRLRWAWTALVAFWAFMVLCAVAKDRTVRWWKAGGFGTGGSRSSTRPGMVEA